MISWNCSACATENETHGMGTTAARCRKCAAVHQITVNIEVKPIDYGYNSDFQNAGVGCIQGG